jgi:uncharacterized protein YciI
VPRFVVTRVHGPAWDDARDLREQDGWAPHAAFMDGLAAEGSIVLGGPVGGAPGRVLLVVDAPSAADVQARFEADPWAATDQLRVASVEPWTVLLSSLGAGPEAGAARFAVLEDHGPAWDHARALREQDGWDAHAAFMDALAADGFVVLGGPLGAGDRVLLAVAAESPARIEARLAEDPWIVVDRLRVAAIEPWQILLAPRA